MQNVASANGIAVDHSNDRLWQAAYLHLHIEHAETRYACLVDVAATPLDVHVATRAEGFVACSGQYDYADVLCFATPAERLRQLPCGLGCKGIAIARTVDGYLCYSIVFFQQDFFKISDVFPFSFAISYMCFYVVTVCCLHCHYLPELGAVDVGIGKHLEQHRSVALSKDELAQLAVELGSISSSKVSDVVLSANS